MKRDVALIKRHIVVARVLYPRIRQAFRDNPHWPSWKEFQRWLNTDEEFARKYHEAEEGWKLCQ